MIPGPTEMAPETMAAMGRQAVPHYGDEWVREHNETLDLLAQAFQTQARPLLLVGTGTCGLEAGLGSLLQPGERVAVTVNGGFGDRWVGILETMGLEVVPVIASWGEAVTRDDLRRALDQHGDVKALAAIHGETSTGVLNPIDELAAEAHEWGALVVVDAISTFGGAWLPVDEWEIDICVGSTQKCLAAPPGLCPVAVSERAWEAMEAVREANHRSWYLNLLTWRDYARDWADWHPYPVTMACALVLALKAALSQLLDEGLRQRCDRLARLAKSFRAGVRALGCHTIANERWACPTTTAVGLPEGVSGLEARRFFEEEKGLVVAFGFDDYRERGFRVGHFGAAATWECTAQLLEALGELLAREGRAVGAGAGVAAAEAAFRE
jgi:alanine-glyoxylate transaminase/serine-glyoxylate transaminase/serine-pyruvate transaminase